MKIRLLLLASLFSTLSYAQTFDWSSVSFNGTNYVRQTVAGIQAECTNSSNTVEVLNGGGFAGSNGNIITSTGNVTSMSVTFSVPIDIQSIFAFDGNGVAGNWTFSPTGGANSNVVQSIATSTGSAVNVNWTNVTSFTITSSSGAARFALDDIVFTPIAAPCIVNIPDANFKAYLVGKSNINTNGDTEIQCSEATAFTGVIACTSLNISDLTGIEAFTNITLLFCYDNQLNTLDVSANTALTLLSCADNNLTSLDVSTNTALGQLICGGNNLTSLNVSTNINLGRLDFSNNSLTTIDLSTNLDLGTLDCSDNSLTSLNISANLVLDELYCSNNNLTSIDTSSNIDLGNFTCHNNSLQSLDVSANTSLYAIICNDNQLTSLKLANGNNNSISFMHAQNNTALTCIQIDGAFTPPNNSNWQKDATASYSDNCSALSVGEFDFNTVSVYPNPATSILNIKMDSNFLEATIYSVLGKEVLRSQKESIDVSSLSNGLYLIKIEDQNGSISTKRFIKK